MSGISSGYGNKTLPFWAVFNLYVIFICTSIPGLAITPIMGDLTKIFPGTTPFETQLLDIGPNLACIPFMFIGGWIGTKFNNNRLTTWTCIFYSICSILFFFVPNMIWLIVLSFLIGIFAGILGPLSSAFIADMFNGKKRTAQYGYTSATLNLVLMASVIATGYLAKINWRLPFIIYLLPIIPLFFAKNFGKYVTNPEQIRAADAKAAGTAKVHYKFTKEVNMPMLIRYCIYYFIITMMIGGISLYLPFVYSDSGTAGDLTSVLFFGIMASGYCLNWCVKVLHKKVAIWVMVAIGVGFLLMALTKEVIIVGLGILIATFFYGIAQPYYYDRLSMATSRIALTLTLAWFGVMDSVGNVLAAPVFDFIAKIFHHNTDKHPQFVFTICVAISIICLIVLIIRKVIVNEHARNEFHDGTKNVGSVQPIPAAVATTTIAPASAPAVPASAPAAKTIETPDAKTADAPVEKTAEAPAAKAADAPATQAPKPTSDPTSETNK